MNKENKHMDEVFSKQLANYKEEPKEELWLTISGRLQKKKNRAMLIAFAKVAAGLLLLTSIGLNIYLFNRRQQVEITEKSVKEEAKPKKTADVAEMNEEPGAKQTTATAKGTDKSVIDYQPKESAIHITETDIKEPETTQIGSGIDSVYNDTPILVLAESKSIKEIPIRNTPVVDLTAMQQKTEEEPIDFNRFEEISESDDISASWEIGGQFAPIYAYRTISTEKYYNYLSDRLNESEKGLISYAGGIQVKMRPFEKLAFQSGIYYSRLGQIKEQVNVFAINTYDWRNEPEDYSQQQEQQIAVLNSTGTIAGESEKSYGVQVSSDELGTSAWEGSSSIRTTNSGANLTFTQLMEYLEIPFMVHYKLYDKKIKFNIIGGINTHILIGTHNYLEDGNSQIKTGTTKDLKTFNYSSTIGLGLDYMLSKRINFNIQPQFRYYLNSVNEASFIDVHPYTFGIYTGINYHF